MLLFPYSRENHELNKIYFKNEPNTKYIISKQTKGLKLLTKKWEVSNPKAIVFGIHGYGEGLHRYNEIAKNFNQKGYYFVKP
jgi:alpha-beta hydrolase superfamily lysophospholipase